MYKVELSCLTCCPLILLYFIYGFSTCILDNITHCLSVEFISSSSSTVSSPTAKLRGNSSWGYKCEKLVYLVWCGALSCAIVLSDKPYCVTRLRMTAKDLKDIYISGKARTRHTIWTNDHLSVIYERKQYTKQIVTPCKIKQEPNRNEWP